MHNLSVHERLLVNSELDKRGKNTVLAYILLIFFGSLGIHRFYLDRKGTAIAQLSLFIGGWLTAIFAIGFVALAVLGVWVFVDLFLTSVIVRETNEKIEQEIIAEIQA